MRDVICFCVDRCFIKVRIVDDEEYEKNEVFYIELDEPELYKAGQYVTCRQYVTCGQYVTSSVRHAVRTSRGQYVTWSVRQAVRTSRNQYVTWSVRIVVRTSRGQYVI